MQFKIRLLSIVLCLMFAGLVIRLFYWQVIKGSELSHDAQSQYSSSQVTTAARGNILANDGSFWVIRSDSWIVYANTNILNKMPSQIADQLAPFFVEDASDRNELLQESERLNGLLSRKTSYIPLAQKVTPDIKKNIEALNIPGLGFDLQESRFYPEGSAAAQLLGFVGKNESGDNVGYFGLEGYYDLPLQGKPGFVSREQDAQGAPLLLDPGKTVSAIAGVDLGTTIDKRVQLLIEQKLKEGIDKYGAQGGSVTIEDPKTGDILGMASYPSFDPANYQKYSNDVFRNPVISDSFEPGSIFKPIVMSAGIDAGVVTPSTPCDICDGPLKVDKYFIKTWNNEYHPGISMTDVIVNSDNVGMSFVGQKLGADKLYDYLNKFGIGKLTGIDLQGEFAPQMRKRGTWSDVDLDTTTFGQGIAVTGIQIIKAMSAIANGGYMYTPRIVESLKGDGWEEKVKSDPPVKVISSQAASETAQMMVEAADRGEAKWTKIPGFKVAGKTGTAQIPVEGHYDATNTNHSFVGFAPADNPKFVMLVTLKSPTSSPWAAETAAPLWYSIAKDLFPYLGVQPEQ